MIELSSLTASVTLNKSEKSFFTVFVTLHQAIGLLLLLQNGGRGIELLQTWSVARRRTNEPASSSHLLLFGAGGITGDG